MSVRRRTGSLERRIDFVSRGNACVGLLRSFSFPRAFVDRRRVSSFVTRAFGRAKGVVSRRRACTARRQSVVCHGRRRSSRRGTSRAKNRRLGFHGKRVAHEASRLGSVGQRILSRGQGPLPMANASPPTDKASLCIGRASPLVREERLLVTGASFAFGKAAICILRARRVDGRVAPHRRRVALPPGFGQLREGVVQPPDVLRRST